MKRNNKKMDVDLFVINLRSKGYAGGNKLIAYLLSQGKTRQEMIDVCLDYTRDKIKKLTIKNYVI